MNIKADPVTRVAGLNGRLNHASRARRGGCWQGDLLLTIPEFQLIYAPGTRFHGAGMRLIIEMKELCLLLKKV